MLILNLAADDRSAILIVKALDLAGYLVVEQLDIVEILGVVGADVEVLGKNPVGNRAVAYLAVAEGAYAHDYVHAVLAAQLEEAAQVAVAGPHPLAFARLVEAPEHVGGQDVDASGAHLYDLFLPLVGGIARIVELAAHGDYGPAVARHVEVVDGNRAAVGGGCAHLQMVAAQRLPLGGGGQLVGPGSGRQGGHAKQGED